MHKGAGSDLTQATPRAAGRVVGEHTPEGEPAVTGLEWGVTETQPKLKQKIIRTRHAEILSLFLRPPAALNENCR